MDLIRKFLPPGVEARDFDGITVVGSDEFLSHMEDTRTRLLRQAPDAWEYIRREVGVIREYGFSCCSPYLVPPTVYLRGGRSTSWSACMLVHEARHCELHRLHISSISPGEELPSSYSTRAEEEDCVRVQLELAARLELPRDDIEHIAEYPERFSIEYEESEWTTP